MHAMVPRRKKLHHLGLAAILAVLPTLAAGQTSPPNDPADGLPMRQLQEAALAFLESPDSGVWSGPEDTFQNAAATFDALGDLQVRYRRFHRGLELLGGGVKLTVQPGGEVSFNYLPKGFVAPKSIVPTVPRARATRIVAAEMGVDEARLSGDLDLALLLTDDGSPARLIWRAHAFHPAAPSRKFYLDARTGEVIYREKGYAEDLWQSAGTGAMYAGEDDPPIPVPLDTALDPDALIYYMIDVTRGSTEVRDMQDSAHTGDFQGVVYTDEDNDWGNGRDWAYGDPTDDATGQTTAVAALWGAQRTWDTLRNVLGLEGYNGMGEPMILRVHYRQEAGEQYGDANFDGTYANFGDGEESDDPSRTQFRTVAHELGHGVWSRQVSMDNRGEASGLNEGHGDITTGVVRHYTYLADGAGPTVPSPERGDLRHFYWRSVNPASYDVDGVPGLDAYVPDMEDMEVHLQGTAYGHMFVILAAGAPSQPEADASPCSGTSYTCLTKAAFPLGIAGIGVDKAAHIWHLALVKYFDDDPTFHEARDAWLNAADDLFGNPSPEHSSVMNAFHAINVGERAEDLSPPEVQTNLPIVDDEEGSILLDIMTQDDIGVVRIDVDSAGDSRKIFADHFFGYINAPSIPGDHVVTVRAWDQDGHSSVANAPFAYVSSNRLFLSRFENSLVTADGLLVDNWLATHEWLVVSDDPDGAFLDGGYIRSSDNHWIERSVTIPQDAIEVRLGYRYRVAETADASSGSLQVQILDEDDQILEIAQEITAADRVSQPWSNDYVKHTYVLSDPYAGQTIKIRFRGAGAAGDAFRIDQAFLVYDAVPQTDLTVEVDEREGSVIFTADVSGISRQRIDFVRFYVGGIQVAEEGYWPYQRIFAGDAFGTDVLLPGVAIAYDHFGNVIDGSGAEWFEVEQIVQSIVNGDFESGEAYWNYSGDVDLCGYNPAGGEGPAAFLGIGCMLFTGVGTLTHDLPIPGFASTASLSFRLKNESHHTTDIVLKVIVYNKATDQTVGTLDEIHGTMPTHAGTSHKGYRKFIYDLTPYKGMNVGLKFEVENEFGAPVEFYIDNVGATYIDFGAPGGIVGL